MSAFFAIIIMIIFLMQENLDLYHICRDCKQMDDILLSFKGENMHVECDLLPRFPVSVRGLIPLNFL